jgi:hypothetical protein
VQGTNGKLQAFGFCESDNPESTLRCIRLLNGYEIAEKKLLVKVDQKTKELLSEHLKKTRRGDAFKTKNAKKAATMRNIPNKKGGVDEEDDVTLELVDEDTLKEDRVVIGALESILKQHHRDLHPEPPAPAPITPATDATTPAATTTDPANSNNDATSNSTPVKPNGDTSSNGISVKTVRITVY